MLPSQGLCCIAALLVAVATAAPQQQEAPEPLPTQKIRVLYHPDQHALSPIDAPWQLKYEYTVPMKLPSAEWDPRQGVFFIWGDTDFDLYGPRNATFRMHDYLFNQIVPQLVIGNALASNDDKYNPGWLVFDDWHIQAQYFWERLPEEALAQALDADQPLPPSHRLAEPPTEPAENHCTPANASAAIFCALCGDVVKVKAGDLITAIIAYDGQGSMSASISAAGGTASTIAIPRPFPNDPSLYADWKAFFTEAEAKSAATAGKGVLHSPDWNIEADVEDGKTLCSVCPLSVEAAEVNVSATKLKWSLGADNGKGKWHAECMGGEEGWCVAVGPDNSR
mmetsp:Transcript_133819/g.416225  ORF Transcript_133819/g.416225 Transcript_133819/m.416225 type:complete len:337 (-) Transcript_133819:15-1025(-)